MTQTIHPGELLAGHRVLEWVPTAEPELVHIAVAFAGRLLSDLGGEVVRVALDDDPLLRLRSHARETPTDSSLLATYLYRNKGQIAEAELRDQMRSEHAPHLLILGAENAIATDFRCSSVLATAVAADSPLADAAVSELGIQGLVGLTDLFGEPGQQPLMLGGHQTAYALGFAVFCAVLANLTRLKLLQKVDCARVNAVDALAWVNWKGVAAGALGFPVARAGQGAEAPVLKCADGFFAFLHMPNNWDDICSEVGDPRLHGEEFARPGRRAKNAAALNRILSEWARTRTQASLLEFCQRCAIPGGPVLHGSELLQDPLYRHRNYFATVEHGHATKPDSVEVPSLPLTVEGCTEGQSPATGNLQFSTNTPSQLPLSGKLVIDLGIFTAGSVTSTLLADLGACVIKVESESYSDPFRKWPGIKGDSPLFTFNNRNKLGLNLDLKTERGRESFLKLVGHADVVVENFRRGVLERLGIDYATLRAANPQIVLASISGQGASGPGSGHVSFGSTLEAMGGVTALTGYPDGSCYISGRNLNYPDQIVCLYGAGAVMAALLKAGETGHGMHIDVSQREVTTLAVGESVAAASLFGDDGGFPGNGNLNAWLQDIYAVMDGWLCVTLTSESQARAVASLIGCAAAELHGRLQDWLETQRSSDAIATLRPMGVAVFKANTGSEAADEPDIQAGEAFAVTRAGTMVKGFPFQFDNAPLNIYEESPRMGEHTDRILQVLGTAG